MQSKIPPPRPGPRTLSHNEFEDRGTLVHAGNLIHTQPEVDPKGEKILLKGNGNGIDMDM